MTNYSLKTGEVVQVENILTILLMSDSEYLEWEASVLGTQQYDVSIETEPRTTLLDRIED